MMLYILQSSATHNYAFLCVSIGTLAQYNAYLLGSRFECGVQFCNKIFHIRQYRKERDKILAIYTQWKTMFVVYLPRSVGILRRRLGHTFYRHHVWHPSPAGDFETANFISCPNMLRVIEKYASSLFPN